MTVHDLGRRTARGGLMLILLRLSLRLIGLVSIVVLFRVLSPEDFGVVALAMLAVGFFEVLSEFGFDTALLTNTVATRPDYDTAWTLTCIRGVTVALLVAVSAPFAAKFLDEPRLMPVLLVLSLAPLLDGVQNIGVVDFSKKLEFQKEFRLRVAQKLGSFAVTLLLAFALRNYWALVVGTVAGRLAGVMLGYAMHPYRPRWGLVGWRKVLRFSSWIVVNNIVLYLGNQTDKVLVQRSFSVHTVGIVRVAEEISGMIMEVVWPVEKALYAGYLHVAREAERFRETMLRSTSLVAAIGVPLSLGLGTMAEPAIQLVLGAKGQEAVPFVQIYILHGAIRSCVCGIFPVFSVLGRPEINAQVTFMAVGVRLAVLFATFSTFGLAAVPSSLVAGSVAVFVGLWWRATTIVGIPWWSLPLSVCRPVLAAAVMALAGRILLAQLPSATAPWTLSVVVPACVLVYVGTLAALWWAWGRPAGAERTALDWANAARRRWLPQRNVQA